MNVEFIEAIEALEKEKKISKEVLIEAIESALVSAYKKNYGTSQNVRVDIDQENGDINVFMQMDVVEELEDEMTQMTVEEAREIDERYEAGDIIEYRVTPKDFGRIAAQTAKQVVVQRIREAERGMVYDDFITRYGEIVTGRVERVSNGTIFVNLGSTEGILAPGEQVPGETYRENDRIKVYIMDVRKSAKGPQVFLSRSHPGLVKRLFELEVPEIEDGTVEIMGIAREAGSRTKMAVYTEYENVDPVGSCVGTRGMRVQAIVDELHGEKIDIIPWSEDPDELIANVLSPAKVERVIVPDPEEKIAQVVVPDYQLSLAIGKEGQNVRLAARVSGWKIDIKSHSQYFAEENAEDIVELEDGTLDIEEATREYEMEAAADEAAETAITEAQETGAEEAEAELGEEKLAEASGTADMAESCDDTEDEEEAKNAE